jgi:hypothetical protein
VDGKPVVTGFVAVGDAWACTNPSAGRGISVGIVHAQLVRHMVRDYLGDPAGFARAWDEGTEQLVAPFYWNQITADRACLAEMTALREGRPWSPGGSPMRRLASVAPYDAGLFRAFLEIIMCLALPQEVMQRPGIKDTIERLGPKAPPPAPGRTGNSSCGCCPYEQRQNQRRHQCPVPTVMRLRREHEPELTFCGHAQCILHHCTAEPIRRSAARSPSPPPRALFACVALYVRYPPFCAAPRSPT